MARIEKYTLKDGNQRYKAIVRRKGMPLKTKTCRTRKQAEDWAKRLEVKILDHRAMPTWEAEKHTLAELIDRYVEEVLPRKPKSAREQTYQLRWWRDQLGDKKLIAVKPPVVSQYRDKLSRELGPKGKKRSAGTVNRYLAVLSHAFTIAMKDWGWVEDNPVKKVSKLKEPRGRVRFLSGEEKQRLLSACENSRDPRLYPLVVLAVSTGARQGELLALRWGDVDLSRDVAILQDTKNNERRAVPITGLAKQVLEEWGRVRRMDTDLVFANDTGRALFPKKPWLEAVAAAELEAFRFHDLRHTAASYLAMSGATLAEIAEVLGHKTLQMVKRFSHLSEQHTSKVVARMNEQFLS